MEPKPESVGRRLRRLVRYGVGGQPIRPAAAYPSGEILTRLAALVAVTRTAAERVSWTPMWVCAHG